MATEQIIVEYIAQVEGMKAQLRTVQTELKNVQKGAEDSAKGTEKSFSNAGEGIKKVGLEIAGALGLAFSVGKVIEFAKESIKAFQESEAASKKLEFAITRIGGEGSSAFDKLIKQAEKFSKLSIFSGGTIKGSQILLAQLGLNSQQIEKLIPKILDLASLYGEDLPVATQRAIGAINGLSRANKDIGIDFRSTGDKTENLNILMDKLGKFTGAAGDAMLTAAGQAKLFDNQINDLEESIGKRLNPLFAQMKFNALSNIKEIIDAGGNLFKSDEQKAKDSLQEDIDFFTSLDLNFKQAEIDRLVKHGANRTQLENQQLVEYVKIKNKEIEKNKEVVENKLGLTEEEKARIAAAQKKADEDALKAKEKELKDIQDAELYAAGKTADAQKRYKDYHAKLKEDEIADDKKRREQAFQDELDAVDNELELIAERDKEAEKQKKDRHQAAAELFKESLNSLFEFEAQKAQLKNEEADAQAIIDKQRVDDQLASGLISREQAASSILAIDKQLDTKKRESAIAQAKRDKAQAVFNIAIATAQAIISALASIPPNVPLSILVGVTGAVQAAAVLAKPLPAFAEGVIDLKGGIKGKDSIAAMLMPGESVMTTDETSRHKDLLQSIRNDSLDKYILQNYVTPKIDQVIREASTANNMASNLKLMGHFPDEYALGRVMSRNNKVNISNADYLAKAIAKEMKGSNINLNWNG